MNLPVEIQAFALSKLDGISLALAKKVCTLWKDIVCKLETLGNIWMVCCLKEIPPEVVVELTGISLLGTLSETSSLDCKTGEYLRSLPWQFWREVYAEFHRCSYVKNCCTWKFTSLNLPYDHGSVTCVKLFENSLVVGHEDGSVVQCDNLGCPVPDVCELQVHGRQVTGVAVVNEKDVSESVVGPSIVSVSGAQDVQMSSQDGKLTGAFHYHSKAINCLGCWGSHVVTGAGDTMLHGQPIWRVKSPEVLIREIVLRGHLAEKTTSTAMWAKKVASGDEKGHVLIWDIEDPTNPTVLGQFNGKIKSIILRGTVLIWLTASSMLYVSLDLETYQEYDVFSIIHRKAEIMALRGSLFAIATKSGFVYLYHLISLTDWADLDLGRSNAVIKSHAEHVNSLSLGDDGIGPVITMATESGVTLVRWQKSIDSNVCNSRESEPLESCLSVVT